MRNRKMYSILFGLGSIALIGNLIYRFVAGLEVGFFEILFACVFFIFFLFSRTWGSKENKDGITPTEEMGKKIDESSTLISYQILVPLLLAGLILERITTGTVNTTLLVLLTSALVLPSIMSYAIAQTYEINPNIIGRTMDRLAEIYGSINVKVKNRILSVTGILTGFFIISPLFSQGRGYYDLLVYIFGEPA